MAAGHWAELTRDKKKDYYKTKEGFDNLVLIVRSEMTMGKKARHSRRGQMFKEAVDEAKKDESLSRHEKRALVVSTFHEKISKAMSKTAPCSHTHVHAICCFSCSSGSVGFCVLVLLASFPNSSRKSKRMCAWTCVCDISEEPSPVKRIEVLHGHAGNGLRDETDRGTSEDVGSAA